MTVYVTVYVTAYVTVYVTTYQKGKGRESVGQRMSSLLDPLLILPSAQLCLVPAACTVNRTKRGLDYYYTNLKGLKNRSCAMIRLDLYQFKNLAKLRTPCLILKDYFETAD